MDATNEKILKQLQEYAAMYFAAIVEKNTDNGKCQLKPGIYSAREIADSVKAACGSYEPPEDSIFDESVEIAADNFKCCFPYRRIFTILAEWEAMCRARKLKAVFEIGEVEEKSAKVLLNEKTELGAFKTKSVKLQRIIGNWWMPRKVKKNQPIELYYELNGVMLVPGKQVWSDSPTDPQTVKWCEQYNDEEISKLLLSFISNDREGTQQNTPYYAEVVNRANIAATPAETPRISTEAAETVNVSAEDGNAENEPIKHISEIMETCRTWDDEKRDYTDEYKYYTWLANHIPEHKATNKNTTELILEEVRERISAAATLAAHGVPKCDMEGAVCAIINRLAKMEDILQFHNRTEPPQSSEAPQTAECTTDTPKPQEMARKEPKQVIRNSRTTQRRTIKRFLIVQSVPRLAKCSTAHHIAGASKMVYSGIIPSGYAPPIRGDCKLSISTRAKPPNRASCEKINILQPP